MLNFVLILKDSLLVCVIVYDGLCMFEFGIVVELFGLLCFEFDDWYWFVVVKVEFGLICVVGGIIMDVEDDLMLL